jgi:hypothetical protein
MGRAWVELRLNQGGAFSTRVRIAQCIPPTLSMDDHTGSWQGEESAATDICFPDNMPCI